MSMKDQVGEIPGDILEGALINGLQSFRNYMRNKYGIEPGSTPRPVGIKKEDFAMVLAYSMSMVVFWLVGRGRISMDRNAITPKEQEEVQDLIQDQLVAYSSANPKVFGIESEDLAGAESKIAAHAKTCLLCQEFIDPENKRKSFGQMVENCKVAKELYSEHHNG